MNERAASRHSGATDQLLSWSMAYKASDAIDAILRTGVASKLAGSAMELSDLAENCGLKPDALKVLLEFTAKVGMLEVRGDRYRLMPEVRPLLPLLEMEAWTRKRHLDNDSLLKVLKSGEGYDPMQEGVTSSIRALYDEALGGFTRALALSLRRGRYLTPGSSVIDLGGADGALANELLRLKVVADALVVDRGAVREDFDARRKNSPFADRLNFAAHDLKAPETLSGRIKLCDGLILSNVVHLLAGPERRRLWDVVITKARPGTRCIVYDLFLSSGADKGNTAINMADLMVMDWLRCGSLFDLSPGAMADEMRLAGMEHRHTEKPPLLPGTIVVMATKS